MQSVDEIRRANLSLLVKRYGTQRALAEHAKIPDPAQISQWINRSVDAKTGKPRVMKTSTARSIEQNLGLGANWMDTQQSQPATQRIGEPDAPYLSQGLRIDPATIAAALKLVRLTFLQREQVIDQEVNAEPLAHAYEFLMARREHTVTPENVVDFALAMKRRQTGESNDAQAGDDRSAGGSNRKHHARR